MASNFGSWHSSFFLINVYAMRILDGVTGVTRNVVAPEEFFASQLAEMEQKGFVDRRENIIALLSCWGFVELAVVLVKKRSIIS